MKNFHRLAVSMIVPEKTESDWLSGVVRLADLIGRAVSLPKDRKFDVATKLFEVLDYLTPLQLIRVFEQEELWSLGPNPQRGVGLIQAAVAKRCPAKPEEIARVAEWIIAILCCLTPTQIIVVSSNLRGYGFGPDRIEEVGAAHRRGRSSE